MTDEAERAREVLADAIDAERGRKSTFADIIRKHGVDAHDRFEGPTVIRAMLAFAAQRPERVEVIEECAMAAYRWWDGEPEDAEDLRTHIRSLAALPPADIAAARIAERERCAKVAKDAAEDARILHNLAAKDHDRDGTNVHGEAWRVATHIAAAIRALGDQ